MHAAALAERLGVETVVVPRASGVLSALGLLAADERHDAVRTYRTRLDDADPDAVTAVLADLESTVRADALDPAAATVTFEADCRYAGQSHELGVDIEEFDPATLRRRFHAVHERTHGYRLDAPVELVTLRATATTAHAMPPIVHDATAAAEPRTRDASFGGAFRETPVLRWDALTASERRAGPAIVAGGESTVVVPPGWSLAADDRGTLRLETEAER